MICDLKWGPSCVVKYELFLWSGYSSENIEQRQWVRHNTSAKRFALCLQSRALDQQQTFYLLIENWWKQIFRKKTLTHSAEPETLCTRIISSINTGLRPESLRGGRVCMYECVCTHTHFVLYAVTTLHYSCVWLCPREIVCGCPPVSVCVRLSVVSVYLCVYMCTSELCDSLCVCVCLCLWSSNTFFQVWAWITVFFLQTKWKHSVPGWTCCELESESESITVRQLQSDWRSEWCQSTVRQLQQDPRSESDSVSRCV